MINFGVFLCSLYPKRIQELFETSSFYLPVYLLRIYTVDLRHVYFLNFLELVLITILKLFCTKIIIFNTSSGLVCFFVLLLPCILGIVFTVL